MNNLRVIRFLWLFLSIIFLSLNSCLPSLPIDTPIATPHGLVPIQNLRVGDKVLTYDLNQTDPHKAIIEVTIKKINKHITDAIFTLYTSESNFIEASPYQLFFMLKATPDNNE